MRPEAGAGNIEICIKKKKKKKKHILLTAIRLTLVRSDLAFERRIAFK